MADIVSKAKRSEIMSRIRGKDTMPELLVRKILHAQGYRFRLHRKDLPGKPDIVLPRYQTVVFVNGCFWHGHSCKDGRLPKSNVRYWPGKIARNKHRDRLNCRRLRRLGWNVVVVWECQLRDTERLVARLERAIEKDQGREARCGRRLSRSLQA